MSEKKGWGSTVLGWFVVQDGASDQTPAPLPEPSVAVAAADAPAGGPEFFQKSPPPAPGGVVDFDAVFEAAAIDDEERQRVSRASDLVTGLPADTPVAVRKSIVEASLKAFGVPIDKIIEASVAEVQALEGYIRAGATDTQKVTEESEQRIHEHEEEIRQLRTVVEQRVQEQQGVVKACNDRKLAIQQILEFFGQDAVARVVQASPKLHVPPQ
jgi:hypothetical protein